MKKCINILLIIALLSLIISFVSCKNEEYNSSNNEENNSNNNDSSFEESDDKSVIGNINESFEEYFKDYITNDSETLENSLTKEYDLSELKDFFEGRTLTSELDSKQNLSALKYSEVNEKYPIEVFRSHGYYSVYKVTQGGFFYVFWIMSFNSSESNNVNNFEKDEWNEPTVYFASYLSTDRNAAMFDSLKTGVNTSGDVKKIDPFLELCTVRSSGVLSYSYLDDKTVLVFEYDDTSSETGGYDNLIIKQITSEERHSAGSKFSIILSEDLP